MMNALSSFLTPSATSPRGSFNSNQNQAHPQAHMNSQLLHQLASHASSNVQLTNLPQLVLLKQSSQGEEKFTRGGVVNNAHLVIKNTPFVLQLAFSSNLLSQQLNFNHVTLEAKLFYDSDGALDKQVDFVKVKPLEWKTHVSERGEQCAMEVRIKVLSSQHEDLFFRIKVVALDARTGKEFNPSLSVVTEPIKVISKPEKVIKNSSLKKRNLSDMLMETVQRLEKQQKDQQSQISKLLDLYKQSPLHTAANSSSPHPPSPSPFATLPLFSPTSEAQWDEYSHGQEKLISSLTDSSAPSATDSKKGEDLTEFEQTFHVLLAQYTTLSGDEKIRKVRKLVRGLSLPETDALSQVLDLVTAEGGSSGRRSGDGLEVCTCKGCHFRDELNKLDDFYQDFMGSL